ncbi:MAG: zinc ribbon domain-containing protein [Candidatus Omnitrophica bacterium]|nr:zinc ribbon domain-containing protein [Candidatus Omnitrophota bacterium]
MPTYDYECASCGNKFEYFQGMQDEPLKECPKCSMSVKRLIGKGAGIIFKGPGFYATDYKAKAPRSDTPPCPKSDKESPACKSCESSTS